jgi:predicted transcriptional regulator
MARRGTFDSKRAQARKLYDEGLSCYAIAKHLKCSPSTVSRWAKAEGLTFDRSKTAAAVEAHTVDLAAGRIRLAEKMLATAETMLDKIDEPYLVFNFGGKDNDYNERVLDSAPVEVRRSVIVTAGITFDKLTRIVEKDTGPAEAAAGVLDQVASALAAATGAIRAEDETPVDAG